MEPEEVLGGWADPAPWRGFQEPSPCVEPSSGGGWDGTARGARQLCRETGESSCGGFGEHRGDGLLATKHREGGTIAGIGLYGLQCGSGWGRLLHSQDRQAAALRVPGETREGLLRGAIAGHPPRRLGRRECKGTSKGGCLVRVGDCVCRH